MMGRKLWVAKSQIMRRKIAKLCGRRGKNAKTKNAWL